MSKRPIVLIAIVAVVGATLVALRPPPEANSPSPAGKAVGNGAPSKTVTPGLSMPRAEACINMGTDPAEGEFLMADGLNEAQIRAAMDPILPHALKCEPDEGVDMLRLRFGINVGCNGVVSNVWVDDDDGASERYVECVAAVLKHADFPAHDMPDGMDFEYPVSVSW